MAPFYHEHQRELQASMQTTRIADRLEEKRLRHELNVADLEVINSAHFFFIGSSFSGAIDCSIKSGPPGFVMSNTPKTILYPDYDGNGMFRTLGNISANPSVALLFVEFWGDKRKIRIHGNASINDDKELCTLFRGAQLVVKVDIVNVFSNCPRYLPTLNISGSSEYVEALDQNPLEPAWKTKPDLIEYVHRRRGE